MIISARAPYKYLEAQRIILGLTRTIHFRNWGIPINMKFQLSQLSMLGPLYDKWGPHIFFIGAPMFMWVPKYYLGSPNYENLLCM